jgi:hypothetical protein
MPRWSSGLAFYLLRAITAEEWLAVLYRTPCTAARGIVDALPRKPLLQTQTTPLTCGARVLH